MGPDEKFLPLTRLPDLKDFFDARFESFLRLAIGYVLCLLV